MKKSILLINNLNKDLSLDNFNKNFDFINQNFDNNIESASNKAVDYVKVKYLKGKR